MLHRLGLLTALLAVAACGGAPQSPGTTTQDVALHEAVPTSGSSFLWSLDREGFSLTMVANGGPLTDPDSPFFQSLGTNGRSCHTCHEPQTGMTLSPERVRMRFEESRGTEPLFRPNDGSVSPLADVSTVGARRRAYALLLDRGLIRIGIGMPANAEFELQSVSDPYGYASANQLSLFRRPLPAANLRFLSTVMWDGRETFKDASQPTGFATIHFDLADQANAATTGHAQGQPLSQQLRDEIFAYEMQVFTAQQFDFRVGMLDVEGAKGGPTPLISQEYYFGINDPLGADPKGFNPVSMTAFEAWGSLVAERDDRRDRARASIARGEAIFNARPISIIGVSGLNDDLHLDSIPGTCTTCHDTPNSGNHSVPAPLRIGTSEVDPVGGLDVSGLPVYTLRNLTTGQTVQVTDPGRALITGKWKDIARIKGPILRGLASRAPYFHNGSARSLADVVTFYDVRFGLQLTEQEKSDLEAFLAAL